MLVGFFFFIGNTMSDIFEFILLVLSWFIIVDEIRSLFNKSYIESDYSKSEWKFAYNFSMFIVSLAIIYLINYYRS